MLGFFKEKVRAKNSIKGLECEMKVEGQSHNE